MTRILVPEDELTRIQADLDEAQAQLRTASIQLQRARRSILASDSQAAQLRRAAIAIAEGTRATGDAAHRLSLAYGTGERET